MRASRFRKYLALRGTTEKEIRLSLIQTHFPKLGTLCTPGYDPSSAVTMFQQEVAIKKSNSLVSVTFHWKASQIRGISYLVTIQVFQRLQTNSYTPSQKTLLKIVLVIVSFLVRRKALVHWRSKSLWHPGSSWTCSLVQDISKFVLTYRSDKMRAHVNWAVYNSSVLLVTLVLTV